MRNSPTFVEVLCVHVDYHIERHTQFACVDLVQLVKKCLPKHSTNHRQDVQEFVSIFVPPLHLINQLPTHVCRYSGRLLRLLPLRVFADDIRLNNLVTLDDVRISSRSKLNRADRNQRKLHVGSPWPWIVLNLHHLLGDLYPFFGLLLPLSTAGIIYFVASFYQ